MPAIPRILLIDDDASFYRFMGDLLGEDRVRLDWRACGRDGLRAFGEGRYDLVLLDHQMPDMLGTEVLEKLREAGADVPIVMLTGYATVDVAIAAMKRGAADFFTKPLTDPGAFIRFLNRTLSLEEPLSLPPGISGAGISGAGISGTVSGTGNELPAPPKPSGISGTGISGTGYELPISSKPSGLTATGNSFPVPEIQVPGARTVGVEEIRALSARLNPPVALSRRECEVAAALLSGRANKEVAALLHISERTVKNHLTHVYAKFNVDGRSHLFNLILTQMG